MFFEMFTRNQAKEAAEKAQNRNDKRSLASLLNCIKIASSRGSFGIKTTENLSKENIKILKKLGYKVQKMGPSYANYRYHIYWD